MIAIAILTLGFVTGSVGTPLPHAERATRLSDLVATSVGGVQALAMLDLASERELQLQAIEVWRTDESCDMVEQSAGGQYREAGEAASRLTTLKYAKDQFNVQLGQLATGFAELPESARPVAYMNAPRRLGDHVWREEMKDPSHLSKFRATLAVVTVRESTEQLGSCPQQALGEAGGCGCGSAGDHAWPSVPAVASAVWRVSPAHEPWRQRAPTEGQELFVQGARDPQVRDGDASEGCHPPRVAGL